MTPPRRSCPTTSPTRARWAEPGRSAPTRSRRTHPPRRTSRSSSPARRPTSRGFCGRRITAQIDAALATRGAEADALWRRVYGSIDRAVPAVPLLNRRTLTLVSRRVGNYAEHPLWGPLLDQIWVR